MKAVILAGGLGTRLSTITNDQIPKCMVKVNGKPILEYQIQVLKDNGVTDIIIIGGHLFEKIESYFGKGDDLGVNIKYIVEEIPLGTGGGLYFLKEEKEDFLVVFGDLLFDINVKRFFDFHREHDALATVLVHPNSHPFDSDLVSIDEDGKIIGYISKHEKRLNDYMNLVSAGIYIISAVAIKNVKKDEKLDLEKDILFSEIMLKNKLYAYHSTEYVKDLGTPERLLSGEQDLKNGIVSKKNLVNRQRAIFLDRDGTLIKFKDLLTKAEDVELEKNVCEAIKLINKSQYLCFVITNQPVIARNLCTEDDVKKVHRKIETVLGEQGGFLDGFKFCPHHPDKGFPGENVKYKINCNCRKPKIGMIEKFAREYNIDLEQSWIIGDTTVDIQTGKNAGLHTILLLTGLSGRDKKYEVIPTYICDDLLSAVQVIIGEKNEGRTG